MKLPHRSLRVLASAAVVATSFATATAATADDEEPQEEPLQTLHAPFTCGTEWVGYTRPGHGLNDWNLDLNRTSRSYSEPQHDLDQPLLAQADGTIVWIGWHESAGTYVEIDYGGITARYIHVVDGSVPDSLEIGSSIAEGQLFGLLGDTGNATHAHLHLEYLDSRDYDDARAWVLPAENQIQIAMDGEIIDPGETFVSTNCDGEPPHPFSDVSAASYAYDDIALLHELEITLGTGAGTYSPDLDVDREQMAAFLARLWRRLAPETPELTTEYPFDDIDEESYARDDVHLLFELGITTGTSATTYSPDDNVTREQMAAFLNRLHDQLTPDVAAHEEADPDPDEDPEADEDPAANEDPAAEVDYPFDDVTVDSFAYDDIATIHELGITTGTSATTYSPEADVNREQMAAFLARLYRLLEPPS